MHFSTLVFKGLSSIMLKPGIMRKQPSLLTDSSKLYQTYVHKPMISSSATVCLLKSFLFLGPITLGPSDSSLQRVVPYTYSGYTTVCCFKWPHYTTSILDSLYPVYLSFSVETKFIHTLLHSFHKVS